MKNPTYANKGQAFERLLIHSAATYRRKNQAVIDKIPTSWIVQRAGKRIISAFPEKKSGVDFVGIVATGRPIAIEAKSTNERTRFPLSLIEPHQAAFLQQFHMLGGIAFVLIDFVKLGRVYRLPYCMLSEYLEAAGNGGRKSIPIQEIESNCDEIRSKDGIPLHFLHGLL